MNANLRKAKAIEYKNKKLLQRVNQYLDEKSGIYFLTRTDEDGINYVYVGQAKRLLTRLAQHLAGYQQHIDKSLKKHGLYSVNNHYGWKVGFEYCPVDKLDEREQHYIKQYAQAGFQLRNKTGGSQGTGKKQIDEYRPAKGYHDGIKQGKKSLAKELSNIIEKHLEIRLKESKKNNKISMKAFEKFKDMLSEDSYDD